MTRSPLLSVEDAQAKAAAFLEARRTRHLDFRMEATDDAGENPPADDAGSQEPPAETPEEKIARLEAERDEWKGHSRKHEDTAKANKAAAAELAALKAAGMNDADKIAAAEKVAAEARAELARYKVAAETGIPADLLVGDDEDAMRAYAGRLKEFRGEQKKTPKPDPSQGPKGEDKKTSQADIGRAEAQRRHGKK